MIEEPEAKASETSQKPNSSLDHRTISPPRRDRWVRQVAPAGEEVEHEVAVRDGVDRVLGDGREAELAASASRSVSKFTPARAPAPSGSRRPPAAPSKRGRSRSNIQK
jgi:hypothetical protein